MLHLILISGWAHAASNLEELRKRLAARRRGEVIALSTADLWSEPPGNSPPSGYARNLKAMLEKKGGKAFVAGWSLGGMIALETAVRWPDLFAGLILISSTPRFCIGKSWPTGTSSGALHAMLGGLKRNPRDVFRTFFKNAAAFSRDAETIVKARIDSAAAMNPRELICGLEYLRDADFRDAVKNLDLPALIIHGGRDAVINVEAAHQLNRLLALSRLRIYEDYGHGLPCQNPRRVADDITGFIESFI